MRQDHLHGMAGLGTGNSDAWQLVEMYKKVIDVMQPLQPTVSAGIGTDTDGFAPGMPPRCFPPIDTEKPDDTCKKTCDPPTDKKSPQGVCKRSLSNVQYDSSFPMSMLGTMSWDYNIVGVAHYGMLADFRKDMATAPDGPTVISNMNQEAEYFFETWKICEDRKNKVN